MKSNLAEKIKSQNNSNDLVIGSDTWLLKEARGNTLSDKFVLNTIKLTYRCLRLLFRMVLGKAGRDKLWTDKRITFRAFLYKAIERIKLDDTMLLVFEVPKYKYKFYSKITLKINNFAIQDMFLSMSAHEEEILEHFNPKEGDIVIDIGAAFGFYTILAAKMIGPTGKVFAFEPQPDNFQMLNSNINLNKLPNVNTLNYAIHSTKTKLKLYSSYSFIPGRAGTDTSNFIEVNCDTLDNLIFHIAQIKEVNWIKIDVEGAELEVLKGAHNILSKSKDIALLIEIHNIEDGKNLYSQIIDLLNNYNLRIEFEKVYDGGERHIIVRK